MDKLQNQKIQPFIVAQDELVRKILEVLFLEGELNLYQIEKKAKLPHATAHKKVKEALKVGLLEIASTSKFRTGLTSKFFKLTPTGYHFFLSNLEKPNKQVLDTLSKLATEKPDLHPALKWFKVFMNGTPLLQSFYLKSFHSWENDFPQNILSLFSEWKSDGVCLHTVSLNGPNEKLRSEIIQLLKTNVMLRSVVLEQIEKWKNYYKALLNDVEKIEKSINQALHS